MTSGNGSDLLFTLSLLAGEPLKFFAHNDAWDTEPLTAREIQAATKQAAKIIKRKKARDYIVILNEKTQPFRIFGSEPARLMERNPRVHTCDRCLGPHNTAKCTFASVCRDCGTPKTSHRDTCKPVPQYPNCLGPEKPGHVDCPVFPKVKDSHVKKPTAEQRAEARKTGKAAYRNAVRDLKKEKETSGLTRSNAIRMTNQEKSDGETPEGNPARENSPINTAFAIDGDGDTTLEDSLPPPENVPEAPPPAPARPQGLLLSSNSKAKA